MTQHTITELEIREVMDNLSPIILAQSVDAGKPGIARKWKTLYYKPNPGLLDKYIVIKNRDTEIIRTGLLSEAIEEYNKL